MSHADRIHLVRRAVREALAARGVSPDSELLETILVADGRYAGRSFAAGGWRAVWMIGEDAVKLFGRGGQCVGAFPAPRGEAAHTERAA